MLHKVHRLHVQRAGLAAVEHSGQYAIGAAIAAVRQRNKAFAAWPAFGREWFEAPTRVAHAPLIFVENTVLFILEVGVFKEAPFENVVAQAATQPK
jgi:hypothetical protein